MLKTSARSGPAPVMESSSSRCRQFLPRTGGDLANARWLADDSVDTVHKWGVEVKFKTCFCSYKGWGIGDSVQWEYEDRTHFICCTCCMLYMCPIRAYCTLYMLFVGWGMFRWLYSVSSLRCRSRGEAAPVSSQSESEPQPVNTHTVHSRAVNWNICEFL